MPVTFKSQATGNLVMIAAHAEALLKQLGKTATEPGILEVRDMPRALATLRALEADAPPDAPQAAPAEQASVNAAGTRQDDLPAPGFQDEPVSLRQRAAPFIRLIEQAQAGGKPIVWGV